VSGWNLVTAERKAVVVLELRAWDGIPQKAPAIARATGRPIAETYQNLDALISDGIVREVPKKRDGRKGPMPRFFGLV